MFHIRGLKSSAISARAQLDAADPMRRLYLSLHSVAPSRQLHRVSLTRCPTVHQPSARACMQPAEVTLSPELRRTTAVLEVPNERAKAGKTTTYILAMSHVSAVSCDQVRCLLPSTWFRWCLATETRHKRQQTWPAAKSGSHSVGAQVDGIRVCAMCLAAGWHLAPRPVRTSAGPAQSHGAAVPHRQHCCQGPQAAFLAFCTQSRSTVVISPCRTSSAWAGRSRFDTSTVPSNT